MQNKIVPINGKQKNERERERQSENIAQIDVRKQWASKANEK